MKTFLTQKQKEAVDITGNVVLKACPGSGKTHVVACRVVKQIESWKFKNSGMAILTFTNVACEELKDRLNGVAGCIVGYPHYIGTLDSFISQYVFLPFGHMIMECEEKPAIIQEFSINALEYASKIWRAECFSKGCKPLDFYFDENGVLTHLQKNIATCPITSNKPCQTFKKYCYKHGLATYQDVTIIALRILNSFPAIVRLLARKFPAVIIDEAQDTSVEQMKLIDCLMSNGLSEVMLIGDPDQAIYEWRDADPTVFMGKYEHDLWDAMLLNENFRCSQLICNATKVFSTLPDISIAVGESSEDSFVPRVVKYDPKSKQSVIDYFIETCKRNDIEINSKNVAVLVRGKSGLLGKDYSTIQNLWQNQFTKLLAEATFEKDMGSLNRSIDMVEKALYSVYISDCTTSEVDLRIISNIISENMWKKLVNEFCRLVPPSKISLKDWKVEITKLVNNTTEKYGLTTIGDNHIKTKSRVVDTAHKDFLDQSMRDFFAKSYDGEFLNSTIHGVKGRTFDAVLLIVGTHGKLTSKMLNTYPVDSEPIRTGYVAMTRARRILMVAMPKSIKDASLTRFDAELWKYIYDF